MENKTTPKDFFLHLLGFGALYASAVSLMSLWFQYINVKFPDPLNQYYSYGYEQLRVPMAILIVVFPVFLIIARWISKQIIADPARKEMRIYKWLVYFTLFVSAVTVIISLITIIYQFLGGELTTRFALKALDILLVTLAVFGYYLWHLRTDLATTSKKRRLLMFTTIVVIVGSIVAGFFIVGSPATAREQKFDQQRLNDLQTMQSSVVNYWQINDKLPSTLQDFDPKGQFVDPITKQSYEYGIGGEDEFYVCANFETNTADPNDPAPYARSIYGDHNWAHIEGRYCWNLAVNTPLYPKPIPVR